MKKDNSSLFESKDRPLIYMDKQRAMSFVIKALYFPKPESALHVKFSQLMHPEDLLFRELNPNYWPTPLKTAK